MSVIEKWAIVVDGYSGGYFLQTLLQERNIKCLHILSKEGQYSFDFLPPGYDSYLDASDNDTAELLKRLPHHCPQVDYVLHGCEQGVTLSEALSSALRLPGNPAETTPWRRDKWEMQNALARAGISAIKQYLIDSPADLTHIPLRYPVIVKPLGDGSSINVFNCDDKAGAQALASRTLQRPDSMGTTIRQLVVQERLRGTEYIVNSVSCQGVHHITDTWRYQKRYLPNGGIVATQARLIEPDSITDVVDYTRQALTALQVKQGAAHSEVMADAQHITLIESGARLMGGDITRNIWRELLTQVPAEILVDSYCAPERLAVLDVQVKRYFCIVLIPVLTAGRVMHLESESWLREQLPTLYDFQPLVQPGENVDITRDDVGPYIGIVRLMSSCNDELDRDLAWLQMHESKLFTLHPHCNEG